jgi:hypothetical protein
MPALDQWERRLKPQFKRPLRIIGEIPLTRAEIEDIAAGVRSSIQRNGIAGATRIITGQYPHVFLAFLAGFAAHNTEQSYWIALGSHLEIDHTKLFNHRWHHTFQDEVKRRGLQYFDYLDAATPYVTTVRFHGGIPAYSLPDFFERLLLPTVKRAGLNEVPTRDAMARVLRTAYFVDSPVINFLEYSGQLGLDLFDACRRMARHYIQNKGDLLPAEELNLPEYVVEAFAAFMERTEEQKEHIRKPVIGISPYDQRDCLMLLLPEQEIPLRYAQGTLEWEMNGPGLSTPQRLACTLRKRRQDTFVEEIYFPITFTAATVKVGLLYRENGRQEVLRRWTLPLLPATKKTPLLAFTNNGVLINASTTLPAGTLILAYPTDTELCLEGPGQMTEEFGQMEGVWQGWQVHAWDLSETWALQVCRAGAVVGDIISIAGRLPEPHLVGGRLSAYGSGDNPLYIGELPAIQVPLRSGADAVKELSRWRVKLSSVWNTSPEVNTEFNLSSVQSEIDLHDDCASYSLHYRLGLSAVGTYEVRVEGPGGSAKDFRFRIWPSVTPIGLPRSLLPAEHNHLPVCFSLRLPDEARCESQAGVDDVEVTWSRYGWDIIAGPDATAARLNLVWEGGKTVRVPVSIAIPRVRWALALDMDQQQFQWTSSPLQKSALALLQSSTAAVHIQAAGLRQLLSKASLELVEVDEEPVTLQEEKLLPTVFSPDWMRVSLQKFRGTLEHSCQQGRFDFVLRDDNSDDLIRMPILQAPRQIEIDHVQLIQISETSWKISWREEFPLKNRRIMLLSSWQPWQEAWEYKIPDKNRGEFILKDVALPCSRYHIFFYITPSWETVRATPPDDLSPHIIDLCAPESRLAMLDRSTYTSDEEKLRSLAEKVLIYHDLGEEDRRDETISECAIPAVKLVSLRVLLGFVERLKHLKIENDFSKFLWKKIYNPQLVNYFLHNYRRTDPLLQRYLGHVSRDVEVYAESALMIAERSNDPAVLLACIKQLLSKREPMLILLILDLIKTARLSNRDAADLLSQDPLWALQELSSLTSSDDIDVLVAEMLPSLGQTKGLDLELLVDLMLRAIPFEKDAVILTNYLLHLMQVERKEALTHAMSGLRSGVLTREDVKSILSASPKAAVRMLENAPAAEEHQYWLDWLITTYPQSAGIIKKGVRIKTPVGVGVVDRMEDLSGHEVHLALLSSCSIRINLLVGDGMDRMRIWLNLDNDTMTFFEAKDGWQCEYCQFAHPDNRVIDKHYKKHHGFAARRYIRLPGTFRITRSEIELEL